LIRAQAKARCFLSQIQKQKKEKGKLATFRELNEVFLKL